MVAVATLKGLPVDFSSLDLFKCSYDQQQNFVPCVHSGSHYCWRHIKVIIIIMIKYAVLISAGLILVVSASPQKATLVSELREMNVDGSYQNAYETSDGTKVEERGYIKNPQAPPDEQILVKEGSYMFRGTDGRNYKTTYIADERGYRPKTTSWIDAGDLRKRAAKYFLVLQ